MPIDTDLQGLGATYGKSGALELPAETPAAPKHIKDDTEFKALTPGTKFVGPDGKTRERPVLDDHEYNTLPEGSEFIDPEGNRRKKPKYEGIDFTTQTLFDMAQSDKGKENALIHGYGKERVKRGESGDLYIEDTSGVLRKPGRGSFAKAALAKVASEAAPLGGMMLGGLAGTELGPAGIAGGGVLGAMEGRAFNNIMLGLAGVDDQSFGEQIKGLGYEGLGVAGGEVIGKGIGAVAPYVKEAVKSGTKGANKAVAMFLGADKAATTTARELSESGEKKGTGILGRLGMSDTDVRIPPSSFAKEAPALALAVETYDPAFRKWNPLGTSAESYMEKQAGGILRTLGVEPKHLVVNPDAAVSTQEAGKMVLEKVQGPMKIEDAILQSAAKDVEESAAAAKTTASLDRAGKMERLRNVFEQNRAAAQQRIDTGFLSIRNDIDQAMQRAKANLNTGELWEQIGKKFQQTRAAIVARHNIWYEQSDIAAAGKLPDSEGLPELAETMLSEMPGDFEKSYPRGVQMLRDLAGVLNKKGEWVKPPVKPTFGQLHKIRSYFRNNVNWYELPSDFQNGTFKFLASKVDNILHDPKAAEELQVAAQMLDATDRSYGDNIKIFNDARLKAVVKGLESGEPADPKILFDTLVKEGRTDLIKEVETMVGPNLWAGVRAADKAEMLDAAKSYTPGQIDGRKFASEVLKRHRSNMLEAVHGKHASEELLRQAEAIASLNGDIDVPVRPGDTLTEIIAKTRSAADQMKARANADPLGTLHSEMELSAKRDQINQIQEATKESRKNDPLGFLYNLRLGANEAVEKILDKEDLILAAAARFGEQSKEFNALRQVWVQRILRNTLVPGERLAGGGTKGGISDEVQQVMFPGITIKQMKKLAENMDFLTLGGKIKPGAVTETALSMSAIARVNNPWAHIIGGSGGAISKIVATPFKLFGGNPGGRAILTKYYALIQKLTSSPSFLRWVEKGLEGGPVDREAVRQAILRGQTSGMRVGGAVAESIYNNREPQRQAQ